MRLSSIFIFLVLSAVWLITPFPTMAGSPATWQGEIDSIPTWITVVPRGHEIPYQVQRQEPWWQWGNATTDAYLFAFEDPNNVRLILDFATQPNGTPEARLYVNQKSDEPIRYVLEGDQLQVQSNGGYPYITLHPDSGGWLVQDQINYELNLSVDGALRGFGVAEAPTDGVMDVQVQAKSKQPGVLDASTFLLTKDPYPDRSLVRFYAVQRMDDAPPFKVAAPTMPSFPYLGIGREDPGWFKENPSPLYFNFGRSELELFIFPGFQTGGTYAVNSQTPPPEVSFEAPYAYYSFDPTTRFPQLLVRADYHPTEDPYTAARTQHQSFSSFRYAWKMNDNERWKYAINVAGSDPYTSTIEVAGTQFLGVPATELPGWVVSKPWPMTTFVEAVNGYAGLESIYFYSTQTTGNWPWLYGASDTPPAYFSEPFLQQSETELRNTSIMALPIGFRGEYNTAYFHQPELYLSPVDNRLHLLNAQGGVWNLGNGYVLRTHNLNSGAYINGWTREIVPEQEVERGDIQALPGEIEEALYALDGYMLYSGGQMAELGEFVASPSQLDLLPPQDRATWQAFKEKMAPYTGQERDPMNLKQWSDALSKNKLSISNGQISQVRQTEDGFRFTLTLQRGYQIHGEDPIGLQDLKPGKYAVIYDGNFRTAELTPPQLALDIEFPKNSPLRVGEPARMRVTAANSGLEDAENLTLVVQGQNGGDPVEITRQNVKVFSGEPAQASLSWQPGRAGIWEIKLLLEDVNGTILAERTFIANVTAGKDSGFQTVLSYSTEKSRSLPAFLVLLILALVTAFAVKLNRNRPESEAEL